MISAEAKKYDSKFHHIKINAAAKELFGGDGATVSVCYPDGRRPLVLVSCPEDKFGPLIHEIRESAFYQIISKTPLIKGKFSLQINGQRTDFSEESSAEAIL